MIKCNDIKIVVWCFAEDDWGERWSQYLRAVQFCRWLAMDRWQWCTMWTYTNATEYYTQIVLKKWCFIFIYLPCKIYNISLWKINYRSFCGKLIAISHHHGRFQINSVAKRSRNAEWDSSLGERSLGGGNVSPLWYSCTKFHIVRRPDDLIHGVESLF